MSQSSVTTLRLGLALAQCCSCWCCCCSLQSETRFVAVLRSLYNNCIAIRQASRDCVWRQSLANQLHCYAVRRVTTLSDVRPASSHSSCTVTRRPHRRPSPSGTDVPLSIYTLDIHCRRRKHYHYSSAHGPTSPCIPFGCRFSVSTVVRVRLPPWYFTLNYIVRMM